MPRITSNKPRPAPPSDDDFDQPEGALRSAQVALASLAATDEEFAAGVPLSDPGSILSGNRSAPEGAKEKPPNPVKKKPKPLTASMVKPPKMSDEAMVAGFKRRAKMKKNTELLAKATKAAKAAKKT